MTTKFEVCPECKENKLIDITCLNCLTNTYEEESISEFMKDNSSSDFSTTVSMPNTQVRGYDSEGYYL